MEGVVMARPQREKKSSVLTVKNDGENVNVWGYMSSNGTDNRLNLKFCYFGFCCIFNQAVK